MGERKPEPDLAQFLLHTCHDVRSCLRAIRVHAEFIAKASPDEHAARIIDGTSKLELLVNGLSSYSLACQIDRSLFVRTPLEVVLRAEIARMGKLIREHEATVTYDPLPRIECDPDRVPQLFENLIRNALAHRGECAPLVHFSAEEQEGRWLFSVRDNGPGIEPSYLDRIFQPFERLRGQQSAGPGLGLATCRKIVENHGGEMWAQSKLGAGSTFFFTLPCT